MSGVQQPRAALLLQEAARLHSKGDVQAALERCRAALVKEPESAPALNLLGVLALEGRDAQAGIDSIRRATAIDPSNPEYLVNLGLALAQIGELEEAEQAMERATRSPVAPSQAFLAYAQLLIRKGDSGRALEILWGAVQSKPEDQARWLQFTEAFTASSFTKIDDPAPLLGVLRMCFERDGIDYQRLVGPARQILWHHAPLADLRHLVETANTKAIREAVWDGRAVAALAEPAVLAVLKRAVLPDPSWERVLTAVRGELLAVTTTTDPPAHVIFEDPSVVCALARQCFLNGYAFFCTEEEGRRVDEMSTLLAEIVSGGEADPANVARVALLACYRPLLKWDQASAVIQLAQQHPHPEFVELLVQQIEEPLEELQLAAEIPTFGEVRGKVSATVQAQYEEHPYPRWVSLDLHEPKSVVEVLRQLFPDASTDGLPAVTAPEVLVAGCGTGKNLGLILTTFEGAKVTGLDLSRTSLAYGLRMMRKLGAENLTLIQADILSLEGWDARFDVMECSGVLHHMEDPAEGWRILTDLVRPGGLMKISLYSEIAREVVVKARQYIAEKGYEGTDGDIRRLRRDLLEEEARWADLVKWHDFYILEECRDLLLHVQEHRFTVPRIGEIVEDLGLDFLGFEVAQSVLDDFRTRFPEAGAERSFESWHRFETENPATFGAMYMFWLRNPR